MHDWLTYDPQRKSICRSLIQTGRRDDELALCISFLAVSLYMIFFNPMIHLMQSLQTKKPTRPGEK